MKKNTIVTPWRVQQENKLNNNIFLSIVMLLLSVMYEYNFMSVYYIWSKLYNLAKMVFLTLIFRPLSREPKRANHKQRVNKPFVSNGSTHLKGCAIHHRSMAYLRIYCLHIITSLSRGQSWAVWLWCKNIIERYLTDSLRPIKVEPK